MCGRGPQLARRGRRTRRGRGTGARLRTLPSVSSTRRAPRWRQTLRKARGRPSSPPIDDDAVVADLAHQELARLVDRGDVADADPAAEDVLDLPLEHRLDRRRPPAAASSPARPAAGSRSTSRGSRQAVRFVRSLTARPSDRLGSIDLVVNSHVSLPGRWRSSRSRPNPRRSRRSRRGRPASCRRAPARFVEDVADPARGGGRARSAASSRRRRSPRSSARRSRPASTAACTRSSTAGQGWSRLEWAWSRSSTGARPTRSTGTCRTPTTSGHTGPTSRSTATCARRCAASSRTPTRSPSATPGPIPRRIAATAERTDGGFRVNGEKWFVTGGDHAAVYVVMANVIDGADRLPTLFVVDAGLDGIEIVDDPAFTHNYPDGHPTIRFTDVEVAGERRDRRRRRRRRPAARLVHRGAARDRRPLRRRDVAAARRDSRLDHGPRAGRRPRSSTTRGSRSRSPTRPPTPPAAGC